MSTPGEITPRAVVDLLLKATFSKPCRGHHAQFMFGPPGQPAALHRLGSEVFLAQAEATAAALAARKAGAPYLRKLPILQVEQLLLDFLKATYWVVSDYVFGRSGPQSYADLVPDEARVRLTSLLQESPLFAPHEFTTAYPLVPILVKANFVAPAFFLVSPETLTADLAGYRTSLVGTRFPPLDEWDGKYETPGSWLGIRSPSDSSARRDRNAVLGALAMLPHPLERHMFSMRRTFGGFVSFQNGLRFGFGSPNTPSLAEDLTIDETDRPWLEVLASKLRASSEEAVRHVRALEYYYRAWPLSEPERFPILFMALDAIYGTDSLHTTAIVDTIASRMGTEYDAKRLKLLMRLRAAVIHGGAPVPYDSTSYSKYLEHYGEEPVADLARILTMCLQFDVFNGTQKSRRHNYADVIRKRYGYEP